MPSEQGGGSGGNPVIGRWQGVYPVGGDSVPQKCSTAHTGFCAHGFHIFVLNATSNSWVEVDERDTAWPISSADVTYDGHDLTWSDSNRSASWFQLNE